MTTFGPAVTVGPSRLVSKRLDSGRSPQLLFAALKQRYEDTFLLESAMGESRLAEYSFIGFEPAKLIRVKGNAVEVIDRVTGEHERRKVSDPLSEVRRVVSGIRAQGPFRFAGGAVGYISYDAVRCWEDLPDAPKDDLGLPDMEFGVYLDGISFDHATGEAYYYTLGEDRHDSVRSLMRSGLEQEALQASEPRPSMRQSRFEGMVERAKEYITEGDIFQVVLSKRSDFELSGDLMRFYRSLSEINPSPYMYFLKFGERSIIGSSPEMLARVENRRLETFPIAGTRPHLDDPAANARLTKELLADPKERAEHVMLVDLARNDVGRVARYGTVRVPELLKVQQFSHVQHIVSRVVGELRDENESYDALRALFPAGTVSGAPKPRAMEIIDELEPLRRGPYAGAVGYFSFNGNADFAITIRTLVANGKRCSVQAGAGIVADSAPEKEWMETEAKAAGLLKAVEAASRGGNA